MALVFQKQFSTPQRKKPELYSDFFIDFVTYETSKDLARLTNEESVKSSIRNLLMTNRGDRLFNNTLGGDLQALLFENVGPASEQLIGDYIRNTINNYEPRASLIDVVVNLETDDHSVNVAIVFRLINNSEQAVLELVLNRIR